MNVKYINNTLGFSVEIPAEILDKIRQLGLEFHPREFGGIFLGKTSPNCSKITITELVIPTEYESKPNGFTRHPHNLNDRIKDEYNRSEGEINYVGEWHTHPNGKSQFSKKDLKAMAAISALTEVKTATPLLLIAGLTKNLYDPALYIYYQSTLQAYTNDR